MRSKTPILTIILTLVILTVLPSSLSPARAVAQSGFTPWSPFGPQEKKLIITDYGDLPGLQSAFQNGQIDITDFPLEVASTSSCINANFFCTSPTSEFGIFQLDINHRIPFLGISLQENRSAPPPSLVLPVTTGPGCSAGFGQLIVQLRNQEQGNAVILDSLNKLTISNQPSGSPSATVGDSGGVNPTDTYAFPCILAGTYAISSSVYNSNSSCSSVTPTICVSVGGGQTVTATLLVDWNSPSTKQPSQAGVYVGRALSHLLDKPSFIQGVFGNLAAFDDEQVAPSQNVPSLFSNTAECPDHLWFSPCNPVSGYNFVSDSLGGGSEWWTLPGQANGVTLGYSGVSDLRAACDDFVKAGFTVVGVSNSTDCGDVAVASQGSIALSTYAHLDNRGQHVFNAWRTNQGRKEFGIIFSDTINFLFGTPNNGCTVLYWGTSCTPKGATFSQSICVLQQTCAWNIYQGGWDLSPFPQQLYDVYYSSFGSSFCGGPPLITLANYPVYCDPALDTYVAAGEFSPTLTQSTQFFAKAAATGTSNGMTDPAFTRIDQFLALNGWNFQQCTGTSCFNTQSSIVNTIGFGTQAGGAYWTLLNARQVPGYNPCSIQGAPANCASYAPGGGNPNLIRRGFSQDTANLSPFTFNSIWEGDVLSSIFDTMLQPNPNTGGAGAQYIDWGTTRHFSLFNPNEVGCNAILGCATGVTTQIWHLRNDWKFSDGNSITANDVAYSILAYRDVPSSLLQAYVLNVVSATGLDCGPGQPCKTLQVKLQTQCQNPQLCFLFGSSALFDFNIGATQFVLEKSLWAPYCGDPPVQGGTCASPVFDPMYPNANSPGIEVGPGPWSCIAPISGTGVSAGHIGGPCAETSTGVLTGSGITTDGRILLSENTNFVRCCPNGPSAFTSSLYKISYADHNNDGIVNILDLADVASHFGTTDPYWVNPNIASGTTVGAVDLATVAIYFGHGITTPYTPQTLTYVDPQIDPFFCPATGC